MTSSGRSSPSVDELTADDEPPGPGTPAQSSRRAISLSRITEGWRGVGLAATAVTLLGWPGWTAVRTGLDPSWQAGIAEAFNHRLQWGPGLDFTYGPYGFAALIEPFYRATAFIALLYVLAVTGPLACMLVIGLRKYVGLAGAALVAWETLAVSQVGYHVADFASVAALGFALALISSPQPSARSALASTMGGLASFSFLVKLNTGVIVFGLLVLAIAGANCSRRERARLSGQALAALLGIFVVSWAGAGQSFKNLPSFARNALSLVLGYSTAMGGRLEPANIKWWAVAAAVPIAVVFASGLRNWPRRQLVVGGLMVAAWGWAAVKEGFVSGNHFPLFFNLAVVAVAVSCLVAPPRWLYALALVVAACITLETASLPSNIDPLRSLRAFGGEIADVADASRFAALAASSRKAVVESEPLYPATLSFTRGRTLAIEPWEDMVAWADTDAVWDPEPVAQAYSTYTTSLDKLDAAFIASSRAPERILDWRFQFGFDFRDFFMDPPGTSVAVFCHYTQLALTGPWQVLGRVPDRCGRPVLIGTAHAHFGEVIRAPAAPAADMVVARFSFSLPIWAKLEDLVLKAPFTYLTAWSGHAAPVTYRFVTGTAADEHVLSTPRALGYARRFTPAPIDALELTGGGWEPGQGDITVRFFALAVAPK